MDDVPSDAAGAGALEQVRGLLAEVERHLRCAAPSEAGEVMDPPGARAALADAWDAALGALEAPGADVAPLAALLRAIKALDGRVRDQGLARRDAAFGRVREALARLRAIDTTAVLVEEAAAVVCGLGFDRAIVSRIEGGYWIPEAVRVGRDITWAEELLAIGRAHPQRLAPGVIEHEIVERGVAVLVTDVQGLPSVHRPTVDAPRSRSYVAAPITVHGEVIGLLHADCYYRRRDLAETDREVLAMVGEGLGCALARTALLDRLATVREELAGLAASVATAIPGSSWAGPIPGPAAAAGQVEDPQGTAFLEAFLSPNGGETALTPREIDVLRRLAEGDTNARIARRLAVSEGTVKSHVKNIRRMLGAANRPEAAARWLRLDPQRPD
jgi:DNA-binding CsgD family transcriptional regulator/GAF domain-containing protein